MQYAFRFLLLFFVCCFPIHSLAQHKIQVERMVLTDGVDRLTRQFANKLNSPVRGKKAYLWMQLRGSKELLDELKQSEGGGVPIRHAWYKYQSDEISAESADSLNLNVDLMVGKKELLQKLNYELTADGAFSWRVWSGKTQLTPGWWRVDLLYASGEPVICPTQDNRLKACKFSFEVKR